MVFTGTAGAVFILLAQFIRLKHCVNMDFCRAACCQSKELCDAISFLQGDMIRFETSENGRVGKMVKPYEVIKLVKIVKCHFNNFIKRSDLSISPI